jgi:hypothetical protein
MTAICHLDVIGQAVGRTQKIHLPHKSHGFKLIKWKSYVANKSIDERLCIQQAKQSWVDSRCKSGSMSDVLAIDQA